jgi:6-pyruvoyltetrahydropterin/6-carboxytetrahydropterin synthase
MELTKTFTFEASHILPKHPGKCSRLHGHSWVLKVSVAGNINSETGFVMDYADMSSAVRPLIERLDHRHLGQWMNMENQNRIPTRPEFSSGLGTSHMVDGMPASFYPSSENLLIWIGRELSRSGLAWSKLELNETCTSSAVLTAEEFYRPQV